MTCVPQAPSLILTAEGAAARHAAAMAVRTTAADAALTSRDIFNRSFGVITVSENNELIGN